MSDSDDVVERVARAIHEARRNTEMFMDETWDELLALDALTPDEENDAQFELERALRDARAALSATPLAQMREDTKLLDALQENSWDLRCFPVHTGGDDADIGWQVVGHWQAQPRERTIAEVFQDDPRAAIRAALTGEAP